MSIDIKLFMITHVKLFFAIYVIKNNELYVLFMFGIQMIMKINVPKIHFKFKIKMDGNNVLRITINMVDKDMIKPLK